MNGLNFSAIPDALPGAPMLQGPPGSMPAGVAEQPPAGMMPNVVQPAVQGPPPGLAAAMPPIGGAPLGGMPGPAAPLGPADMQYQAVTQEDGSVLLHLMKPDGQLGPVVKIVPAPKTGMSPCAQQRPM